VVDRFPATVQTRRVAVLADITPEDCKALTSAMTKSSRWNRGHDEALAARAPESRIALGFDRDRPREREFRRYGMQRLLREAAQAYFCARL